MASIPDKMYISAVMVPEKRLKCAREGCDKTASPGNQIEGSFMSGADLVSDIDLKYNRIADKVTLYLCDNCYQKAVNPVPPYSLVKPEHTEKEVRSLVPGEFFLNKKGSPCTCVNCQKRKDR